LNWKITFFSQLQNLHHLGQIQEVLLQFISFTGYDSHLFCIHFPNLYPMKKYLISLLLLSMSFAFTFPAVFGQSKKPAHSRAMQGDTVIVIINPVKADKREQFEKFMHQILRAGVAKLSKKEQQAGSQVRVLHPVKAEADGTYNYQFIMDPWSRYMDNSIKDRLVKMYGEAKAGEYYQMLEDAMAGPQKQYVVIQSQH
jgi:hypothetical protein